MLLRSGCIATICVILSYHAVPAADGPTAEAAVLKPLVVEEFSSSVAPAWRVAKGALEDRGWGLARGRASRRQARGGGPL